jgi:hypothetical protein
MSYCCRSSLAHRHRRTLPRYDLAVVGIVRRHCAVRRVLRPSYIYSSLESALRSLSTIPLLRRGETFVRPAARDIGSVPRRALETTAALCVDARRTGRPTDVRTAISCFARRTCKPMPRTLFQGGMSVGRQMVYCEEGVAPIYFPPQAHAASAHLPPHTGLP